MPAESLRVNYASGQGYGNRSLSWPGEIIGQFDPNVLPTERHRIVQDHDFANDDNHPDDDNGHGTHVTGTIAESTNNLIGVAGVAFRCSIMPVKVMDSDSVSDALRRFSRPLGRHVTTAGR